MKRTSTIAVLALAAMTSGLFGAHAALAQSAPAPSPASASTAPPGSDATRGKSAFMRYGCYECHGTLGQGNFTTAPRLAPNPRPYAGLLAYVRKPTGNMPSYSVTIVPDKDVADIYAFLLTIKPGKGPADLPLLNSTTMKPK